MARSYLLWAKDKCALHCRVKCDRCRCPKCKAGIVLESSTLDWCSRAYADSSPCDYQTSDWMMHMRKKT